ncbi:uncharacterized protein At4g08330, chloroplastic isoform X2 [Amborella trichopoda]|uniref:Protein yippee-like n=1 Tax=Amborella trichopoda TaxID=13333 RepID=U5DI41_AMBTC|nr:uncharacterized protein At4g08330, chloroplastic isoform X2 [Amborella trichopoda]ERN20243.1 hypothetical protein AMTR_s00066p00155040 [Amborella trichopoda]|eukprot:XP_006858776.1 uncharacterized protein At4g08330, chloroplastic isoform X2 [Amborella trichopoda]
MSQADVTYSCGSCGYSLNLKSSNRITSRIGSGYQKSIKKGVISFLSVDPSRFTQIDEVKCLPYSWGPFGMKTKLLCRNCGTHIGYGYGDSASNCSDSATHSSHRKYTIKIRAVQPLDEFS